MKDRGERLVRIAFFETKKWEKKHLKEQLEKHELYFSDKPLTEKNASSAKDAKFIGIFIYSKITKKVLDKLPKLKMITTMSTGFDHIDLEECKKRGIVVCNVPAYGEDTVAEHTFALIMNISRKIYDSVKRTRRGDFRLEELRGFDLKGKTIGIVGCGKIGQNVARIAKGFEMRTIVFDVNKDKGLAKKLNFKYASLDSLIKRSDIITLHVPENKHTRHMIDSKRLSLCRKGTVLINTSRGGIVDTTALLKALNSGKIDYAGLDVLEGECFVKEEKELLRPEFLEDCNLRLVLQDNMLLKRDDVYVTPHNAFNSAEALQRIVDTTADNIKGFLRNRPQNKIEVK